MNRYRLLALVGALGFGAAVGLPLSATATVAPSNRHRTPIAHIVTLLQENHTYDNYFGTYPRGDGLPTGTCMPVDPRKPKGRCVRPFHITGSGLTPRDLDNTKATYRLQWNAGRMNGFVHALERRNQDGRLAMAYYNGRDLPYYWNLADEYVLFDRFFSSAGGGSFLNHLYWVAATGAGGRDRISPRGMRNVPTIFDRLEQAGVSWKFYVQNYEPRLNFRTVGRFPPNRAAQVTRVPLLDMPRFVDKPRLNRHIVDLREYFRDLDRGTLPSVSFIVPSGPSEHPPLSVTSGQAFVRTLINQLVASRQWKHSAFVLAYDAWGGWYDHVPPPRSAKRAYGFRVPALLVSPYARRGYADSTVLDVTSILRFIEDNWSIKPLGRLDRAANSIASAFDFTQGPRQPEFVSAQRNATVVGTHVRSVAVYLLYLGAVAVPGLLALWALVRRRTRLGDSERDLSGSGI